jgi:hypothetical protein
MAVMAKAAAILWDERLHTKQPLNESEENRMGLDFSDGVAARNTAVEAACCVR